ncbi:MAG: hypothetical protein KJ645_11910, partial [Planctomycetes bacterium]|nr:hypothetical protein [Planctomycetota bacterium]
MSPFLKIHILTKNMQQTGGNPVCFPVFWTFRSPDGFTMITAISIGNSNITAASMEGVSLADKRTVSVSDQSLWPGLINWI